MVSGAPFVELCSVLAVQLVMLVYLPLTDLFTVLSWRCLDPERTLDGGSHPPGTVLKWRARGRRAGPARGGPTCPVRGGRP
eukprot:scaffold106635_cov68-Phaeocystis_antarctica.AAC.6